MTHGTVALAPAKINLALHVTGRRADGYHLLESLVVFADFGDRLLIEAATADAFTIIGPHGADLPTGSDNLVIAARDRLRAAFGEDATPPVAIHLDKHLPVASGIGGGSSNAAATLRALAELWSLDAASPKIAGIAAGLGADVPMCLDGRALLASGIGHDLQPLVAWPVFDIVLVNPGVAVSTPAVFARLARRDNPPLPPLPDRPDALAFLAAARNDLEAPARALAPSIGEALEALEAAGASFSRMSGSGATCFGIFGEADEARAAAAGIRSDRPGWFVEATRTTGAGS